MDVEEEEPIVLDVYSETGALLVTVPMRWNLAAAAFAGSAECQRDGRAYVYVCQGDHFPVQPCFETVRGFLVRLSLSPRESAGARLAQIYWSRCTSHRAAVAVQPLCTCPTLLFGHHPGCRLRS